MYDKTDSKQINYIISITKLINNTARAENITCSMFVYLLLHFLLWLTKIRVFLYISLLSLQLSEPCE